MALFFECMQQCARKALDTADIVRDGDFSTTTDWFHFSSVRGDARAVWGGGPKPAQPVLQVWYMSYFLASYNASLRLKNQGVLRGNLRR
jgi:hypothetical protein